MENQSNLGIIRDLYKPFAAGKPNPRAYVFNDDSIWIVPGHNAASGVFRGAEEIAEHIANCWHMTDGTWGTEIVDIMNTEKYVVVIERTLGLRNGASLNMLCATIYQMSEGIISEMIGLPFDYTAWDAFWS